MFSFLDDIFLETGLPINILKGGFRVINFCNKGVYIEGFKSIISLQPTNIEAKLPKGIVAINGQKLKIKKINKDSIMITGDITTLEIK